MNKKRRDKVQEVFDEFEMLTGWLPEHQAEVLAGKLELRKALANNVRRYLAWAKQSERALKGLQAKNIR